MFGYYEGKQLMYVARTRSGFTPASRQRLFEKFLGLEVPVCPFVNLPEAKSGRWGERLTKEKMRECCWLKPLLVGQFEFTEWTPEGHLRHSCFVGLREDKKAKDVVKELDVLKNRARNLSTVESATPLHLRRWDWGWKLLIFSFLLQVFAGALQLVIG